jgi:hypothetical protein
MSKNNRYCPIRGKYGRKAEIFFLDFAKNIFKEGSLAHHPDGKLNVDFRLAFPDNSFFQFEVERKAADSWTSKFPFKTVMFLHRRKIRKNCFQIVFNSKLSRFLVYSHDIIEKYKIKSFPGEKEKFLAREISIKQCKEFSVSDVASFKEFVYNRINKVAPTNKKEIKMPAKSSDKPKVSFSRDVNWIENKATSIAKWVLVQSVWAKEKKKTANKKHRYNCNSDELLKVYSSFFDNMLSTQASEKIKSLNNSAEPINVANDLVYLDDPNFCETRERNRIMAKSYQGGTYVLLTSDPVVKNLVDSFVNKNISVKNYIIGIKNICLGKSNSIQLPLDFSSEVSSNDILERLQKIELQNTQILNYLSKSLGNKCLENHS